MNRPPVPARAEDIDADWMRRAPVAGGAPARESLDRPAATQDVVMEAPRMYPVARALARAAGRVPRLNRRSGRRTPGPPRPRSLPPGPAWRRWGAPPVARASRTGTGLLAGRVRPIYTAAGRRSSTLREAAEKECGPSLRPSTGDLARSGAAARPIGAGGGC